MEKVKKLNKKGMGIVSYVLVISLILFIGIGVIYQQNDKDIPDLIKNITWKEVESSSNSTISIGLNKVINTGGWIFMETGKELMQWGAENPDIPWRVLIYLLLIAMLSPIILVLVKLIVIIVIFIRDLTQSQKEKLEIQRLRNKE